MQYCGMQVEGMPATVINYINELKCSYEQKIKELIVYQHKYLEIKERYDLLLWKRFGRSAEQLVDESQQLLFNEKAEITETVETRENGNPTNEELSEVKSYTRKKPGRKALDPNLPRNETVIDIPESEKTCACGAKLSRIGEETSEKLHIIPQQIYVEKIVRPKYACPCCEGTETEDICPTVRIAPVPPVMIPKSITSPGLLSTIFTQKFEMHLPYYRQEKQFKMIGAEISRQDMSNWQQKVYEKLEPLFKLLLETVKSGPVMQMDETTVQVICEEDRKDTQKSYMWLARGGPPDKKVIWYEYHPTRAAYNAKKFLEGYSGFLQTDGYKGYDTAIEGNSDIIHVGCFAHARRKFFEAAKVNENSISANEGIKYIRLLYEIENKLRDYLEKSNDMEKFLVDRKVQAKPVLDKFKAWLDKRASDAPPSILLGSAINYSLAQWNKMIAYLESPYLTPDNNACENAIRPFVLGRKNWLFCQSVGGVESSCGIYTLIETAKQNGLVPFKYLMTLFEKAPLAVSKEDWEKLLPWNIFTA